MTLTGSQVEDILANRPVPPAIDAGAYLDLVALVETWPDGEFEENADNFEILAHRLNWITGCEFSYELGYEFGRCGQAPIIVRCLSHDPPYALCAIHQAEDAAILGLDAEALAHADQPAAWWL